MCAPTQRTEEIVGGWRTSIDAAYGGMHPKVRVERERLKLEQPLKIWFGSPRPGSLLYAHERPLQELLSTEGCEVTLSSAGASGEAAEAEPVELAKVFDLLFLVVASPGTSAEAMELALKHETNPKLHVFLPEEYRGGYLARSLAGRHKVLCHLNYFSLAEAQGFGPDLPRKMVSTVVKYRNYCAQDKAVQPEHHKESATQIFNIEHMGDIINANQSTVVNRSTVTKAFNAIRANYGPTTADALRAVSEHVANSGNKEAGELLDVFNEEVAKAEPRRSVLKGLWEKICQVLPTVTEIAKAGGEIAKVLSGPGQ